MTEKEAFEKEKTFLRIKYNTDAEVRRKLIEFEYEMQFDKPFVTEDSKDVDYSKLPF